MTSPPEAPEPESEASKKQPENRRRHKKSRNGCVICKKRRVKCDEQRPRCARCILASRECSYSAATATTQSDPGRSPGISAASSTAATDGVPAVDVAAIIAAAASADARAAGEADGSFTATHMTLLHHAHMNLGTLMALSGDTKPILNTAVDNVSEAPYLLDQLLALSALHRSVTATEAATAAKYRRQATELQTRALGRFNDAEASAERKPIPSFLFATILGFHVLHDTLCSVDRVLSDFVGGFLGYVKLHEGVRAVIDGHWSQILESDLRPLLYIEWMERKEDLRRGTETAGLMKQLETSAYSQPSLVEACISAANWIQWVLGVAAAEPDKPDVAVQAVMTWPLVMGDDFAAALYQHRPEALVVLAHYGAALHRCRGFWVFGDSGAAVVRAIANELGSFWAEALAWPLDVLSEKLPNETESFSQLCIDSAG